MVLVCANVVSHLIRNAPDSVPCSHCLTLCMQLFVPLCCVLLLQPVIRRPIRMTAAVCCRLGHKWKLSRVTPREPGGFMHRAAPSAPGEASLRLHFVLTLSTLERETWLTLSLYCVAQQRLVLMSHSTVQTAAVFQSVWQRLECARKVT